MGGTTRTRTVWGGLVIIMVSLLLPGAAIGAGEKVAVYGADLAPAGRQELTQLFGADGSTKSETVTTQEMVAALKDSGLPVAPDDKTISSSALTCLEKGEGLTVRTQNITRIPAAVYANALVTAGVGDASVIVAAPSSNPVTGETALVGVLKAFPQCQAGKQPDPERVRLAYEQVARTAALAGQTGDLTTASGVMLTAAQPVITGQAKDEGAIGAALDAAAGGEGVQVDPARRGELVAFLQKLGGVDYGTYAQGYQIQQVAPNQVKVVPAGAGAPSTPGAAGASAPAGTAAATPSATVAAAAAAPAAKGAGATFSGEVTKAGQPLTVRSTGQDRPVNAAPNVVVTRDSKAATLADIRPSDQVTVTTNPDGTAQRIDATSTGEGLTPLAWLLPLLLLPLLGLLFWLVKKRGRNDFILERDATAGQGGDRNAGGRS